jgi:hypothetical protein
MEFAPNKFFKDDSIIKVILELEPQYEATIVADGIHIILKDIKITIEEL